jgi:hypothetical protein
MRQHGAAKLGIHCELCLAGWASLHCCASCLQPPVQPIMCVCSCAPHLQAWAESMQKQCDKMYHLLEQVKVPGPGGQQVPEEEELFGRTYHKFK